MQFGILGPLLVRSPGGEPLAIGGPRPRALLALLLLDAGRMVSVERLIDGQYGDRPPTEAANAIQAQISRLRRSLPAGLIEFHGSGYRLAVSPDDVDAHRFERLSREGRKLLAAGRFPGAASSLREALELWRGPALADVADAPFAGPQALRLEELRLSAMEDLMEAELGLPEGSPVAALQDLVAAHPLRERPRGLLMRALEAAGRPSEALTVFDETRRLLADELGTDPSPELAALHLAILRAERHQVRRVAPPAQLNRLVGREEELARLTALRGVRLVTLVGPGGIGKTRLAIEAATHLQHPATTTTPEPPGTTSTGLPRGTATADGAAVWRVREACFVDLSLVDGTGQVAGAVLAALGLREPALHGLPDPTERLVAALAEQDLLLVLDNCEHVLAEVATLARRLLAAAPDLMIMATSREPLGITGEHLVPLAPLPTDPAVKLFAERAAAVRQEFAVGPGNLDAVLRICAALDCLPLAIELAAARMRTFGVEEIATRLAEHDRFRLLSRGDRTAPMRHQTLHAIVEWSWSLLDAEEQALARQFSVFAGGASLEAVERVCGADSADLLADLVDKSLVETDGERYHMLDTIRLFCAERLAEAGEEDRLRAAHAAWFLEFARRTDGLLYSAEQLRGLALLSADNANLQAALRWSVEHDPPAAARLVAALAMYWWLSGRRGQATRHAVRLLDAIGPELGEEYLLVVLHAVPDAESPHWKQAWTVIGSLERPMRCRFGPALWGMLAGPPPPGEAVAVRVIGSDPWSKALGRFSGALLELLSGDVASAERGLESMIAEFGALGERWGKTQGLDWLGLIASWRGEWGRAMGLWQEAVGLLEELGAMEELADVLHRRAEAHWRAGDAPAARADCERAGELARRLGRPEQTAWVSLRLGEMARLEGDLAEASRHLEAALAASETGLFSAHGARSHVLTALGRLAEATGDAPEAARRHAEALAMTLNSPLTTDLAHATEGLAGQCLLDGAGDLAGRALDAGEDPAGPRVLGSAERPAGRGLDGVSVGGGSAERAAVLLGVGVALRGMAVAGDRDVARIAATATDVLGPAGFAAAYSRGASMSRDDALATLIALAGPGH
ncbi:BTAD domain-containing putative transcriptional regulator [Nonomuraea jabiensis]|uniref:Putative ATPase n=1 Tax=Nonomuraea jabiensis TaxID=882448 RepID=A0A7W9L9H2_9ACTN|nr:BTAD domain-containing putative transcriptional regulator [Nonomuraea jabiensis]MBB5775556.1 putative ATPase [Nonomuraea jabiensis]